MNTDSQRDIENQAVSALNESIKHFDGATLSKLNQARHHALSKTRQSTALFKARWLPMGGLITATTMAVYLALPFLSTSTPQNNSPGSIEFAVATNSIDLDILDELEFIYWLEEQDGEVMEDSDHVI